MNNVDNKMLAFVLRVSDFGERRREHMDWFGGLINMPARPESRLFWNENGYIRMTTFCMLLTEYYSKLFRDEGGNGRVYDSKLGRFLSADKVVQDAGSTQNYNSYSYCLNNPLKYSDPSGWLVAPKTYSSWDWDENFNIDWATGRGWEGNAGGGGAQEAGWGGNNSPYSTNYGRAMGGGYYYDWGKKQYFNGSGLTVSWNEVYNNNVSQNLSLSQTQGMFLASVINYANTLKACGISLEWDGQFKGSDASMHFSVDADNGLISFETYNLRSTVGHIVDNSAGDNEGWYERASRVQYDLGLEATAMENLGRGTAETIGKVGGKSLIGLGVVIDGIGVRNYYRYGPNSQNSVSPGKAALNTSFAVYGIWNPAASIIYGGVDLFYPNGWVGLITDWQTVQNPNNNPELQQQLIHAATCMPF